MSVTITTDSTTVTLIAPYDPSMPAKAKAIGGRWNATEKAWVFDARDESRVRALAREIYGTDGAADDRPTVTLRVPVMQNSTRDGGDEFRVAGMRLAWRPGRDADVRLAPGVSIISGGFEGWGGSMRYPELNPIGDTVLEVRDLPADTAERILATVKGAALDSDPAVIREQLLAERSRLTARIAEIDAALLDGRVSA